MTIFLLIAAGFLGYHAKEEFGSDSVILAALSAMCVFAAICGVLR